MSDTENVSAEVRELMELVLKEPIESATNVTLLPVKENTVPNATDQSIQSMDTDSDVPVVNAEIPQADIPQSVTESMRTHITPAPDTDLRVIESNALKLIAQYGSDSDSEEEVSEDGSSSSGEVVAIDDVEEVLQKTITAGNYRVISSDSEESTSSDDSDIEVISVQHEIISLDDDDLEESDPKTRGPIRVEGEFTIDSLPPIEDLKISVPEEECVILGKVMSIVDQLVVVDSLPKSRPIDIDSILFLDKGTKPLGHVFDVLGNINSPMYCVRFNSNKQIVEKGITVGSLVYVAPRTEHTSFVAVSELMKQRGCDASWKNDIEPLNTQDFSDDEEERKARRMRRGRNNSINESDSNETAAPTSTPTQNGNNKRNTRQRTPRQRRGNFNRGGGHDRNYGSPAQDRHFGPPGQNRNYGPPGYDRNYGPPANHSWHQNLPQSNQQSNWNSPMRNSGPMGPFPQSLLLPPPPPPPSSNSRW
ncbi:H/ACA ribonucleoprotein complex non-core subunit NAF1 [Bradysia coprophila]|uniref:H/ACA ribonucleoprotein complex non-core subunit NAF1 n=1 Tax=Bradysia coprophila TaxID=38358 RepID=UPI00187D746D|nr:H/ACA ribonucleoprotein complex non-core subunit NAF1 [Bradysia coprophila]